MRVIILNLLLFTVGLLSCTKPGKEKTKDPDAYGEYEIADPSGTQSDNSTKLHVVEIVQMKFVPDILNVNKGDTVVWINRDLVDHDVTEKKTHAWTSSRMPSGTSWKLVVAESQLYYCSLHVVMLGKIIVDGNNIAMIDEPIEITMCK